MKKHHSQRAKGMMLIGGDYNVNLVQRYDGSLQEVLKLTMLNQEEIFRKQVLPLLYYEYIIRSVG